jgi:hypothetical protein
MKMANTVKSTNCLSILMGLVCALGIGSQASAVGIDGISSNSNPRMIESKHVLDKYVGTVKAKCNAENSDRLKSSRFELTFATGSANTLNGAAGLHFYSDSNCANHVGSITAYYEITYVGAVQDVEVMNSEQRLTQADEVIVTIPIRIASEGEYDEHFYQNSVKALALPSNKKAVFAREGNIFYSYEKKSSSSGGDDFSIKVKKVGSY